MREPSSEKIIKAEIQNRQLLRKNSKGSERNYKTEQMRSQIVLSDNDNERQDEQQQQSLSDEEADKLREKQIEDNIHKANLKKMSAQKMVVGTGFSMDATEFFQFKKKQQLKSDKEVSIIEEISGSRIAWFILFYSVTLGAIMPGWIMNIRANKMLRISWRFFMQTFMVIPFVLYQYRSGSQELRDKYNLRYIFKPSNFIKPLISSLGASMWFTVVLAGFQWTSVSHSIVLGSLSNFFLSITRSCKKSSHDLESGGQMLVFGGLMLVLYDSFSFDPSQLTPYDYSNVNNTFYYNRQWWEKLTFDLFSFSMSFFTSRFSMYTSDLGSYYPPFLSMFIVNCLNCVNMSFSCYFINGCEWSFNSFFGIWSLFTNQHFAGFMYMAIILSLGQIISMVLITRMFPDPIIPALATTLEPFIATLLLNVAGIQKLPGNFTIIGYLFFVPGLCLILVGQCLFQRISSKRKNEDERIGQLLNELREVKQRRVERQKKRTEKKNMMNIAIKVNSHSETSRKGSI